MKIEDIDEGIVAEWISQDGAFAFFRYPGEHVCHGIRAQSASLQAIYDITQLDGKRGFVFAPFVMDEMHPIWLLQPEEKVDFTFSSLRDDVCEAPGPVPLYEWDETPSESYSSGFHLFSSALKDGRFEKLVYSRKRWLTAFHDVSWAEAFRVACQRYVYSYVYLFFSPQTGFWLGATPEILLAGEGKDFRTVALAGTQIMKDGKHEVEWSDKNIREQQVVTDYICDRLLRRYITPEVTTPRTVTAGSLAHLKTEITFRLSQTDELGKLLHALHPTPAVCGVPKEEAYQFIVRNEGYERSYYTGFLGMLQEEGVTELYVNLRCMHANIMDNGVALYAGGGLLSSSTLEEEWKETERKLQTMKYVIQKSLADVF